MDLIQFLGQRNTGKQSILLTKIGNMGQSEKQNESGK